MSEPAPQRDPPPANSRDLVGRFIHEYAAALEELKVSAAHTATAGWRKLYAAHRTSLEQRRRELAKRLKLLAESLETVGLSEDGEKALGEIKRDSAELRAQAAVFDARTVAPVREPVFAAERVLDEYRRAARLEEQNHPLVNVGLEELMRIEQSKVPRGRWDDEQGTVTLVYPAAESQ